MTTITKGDFLSMVKLQHLEVLTQDQLVQNTKVIDSYMEKALVSELSEVEKADANTMIEDVVGLDQWCVLRDDFSKAVVYTRPEQIVWENAEKGEFGEILKARGGVYKLTPTNKKLGRVGQKYGEGKHEDEFGNKKHQPTGREEYDKRQGKEDKSDETRIRATIQGKDYTFRELKKTYLDIKPEDQNKITSVERMKQVVNDHLIDKKTGNDDKKEKSPDLPSSHRNYLFQVIEYEKKGDLDDMTKTDLSKTGHKDQIQKILDTLPEEEFDKNPFQYDLPKWLRGGVFIAKHKGKRYLIDTQGYDYARYATELVGKVKTTE